jgi:ubiquinone/menaquinone biosynthesis C-methylase UbiE
MIGNKYLSNFQKSHMRLGTYYRAELLKLLNIKADKENVLDVGCFDAYWLSTQSAKNKYALDIDIDKKYRNINYIKASALDIPFEDNKFDQVLPINRD